MISGLFKGWLWDQIESRVSKIRGPYCGGWVTLVVEDRLFLIQVYSPGGVGVHQALQSHSVSTVTGHILGLLHKHRRICKIFLKITNIFDNNISLWRFLVLMNFWGALLCLHDWQWMLIRRRPYMTVTALETEENVSMRCDPSSWCW